MPTYELEPLRGVGPVDFGMTRAACEAAMAPVLPDRHGAPDGSVAFHQGAFRVGFDGVGTVESVELAAAGTLTAVLFEDAVLELPAEHVVERIARLAPFDHTAVDLGYRFVYPALALVFWRPVLPQAGDDAGRTFSTVTLGRPGSFAREG